MPEYEQSPTKGTIEQQEGGVKELMRRGVKYLRGRLQQPQREGLPRRRLLYDPAPGFLTEQQEILEKHRDEEKPRDFGPYAFAVVSRAYKELSNGNLTERLRDLARLEVPESQVRAYISVNNPRIWAISAGLIAEHQQQLDGLDDSEKLRFLKQKLDSHYQTTGLDKSDYENGQLSAVNAWESIEEKVNDFQENQVTLQVLHEITKTVNAFPQAGSSKAILIRDTLARIEALGSEYLTDSQRESFLGAAKLAMEENVAVMGIDCSSAEKAYSNVTLGAVTYEAAQVALSQGAQFLDIADMDNYYTNDSLTELYDLAREERIDVFSRPLLVSPTQHPEHLELSDHMWADLMTYYSNTYTYALPGYWNTIATTTGVIIVSADAFRKHPYPHPDEQINEDYDWFDMLDSDTDLKKRFAVSSYLLRGQRGRPGSIDGVDWHVPENQVLSDTPDELRSELNTIQYGRVARYIKEEGDLIFWLDLADKMIQSNRSGISAKTARNLPDFKAEYESIRNNLFHANQKRREDTRRFFLGRDREGDIDPEGTLSRLYAIYTENHHATPDEIIERVRLSPKRKAFFDQNPLIIPGVIQEIQRITTQTGKRPSLEEVSSYIEETLPELFAPPLAEEPEYSLTTVTESDVNITDWMHIYQAHDVFTRWMNNLKITGKVDKATLDALYLNLTFSVLL